MKVLALIILSLFLIPRASNTELSLEDFIFSDRELPKGVQLKAVGENDRLPCQITTNPFISDDRSFLDCFARAFTRDSISTKNISRALFSVYKEQSEIGLFALETDSEETAAQILNEMNTNIPEGDSSEIIQTANLVLWLWHDRARTKAFDELKILIDTRIE